MEPTNGKLEEVTNALDTAIPWMADVRIGGTWWLVGKLLHAAKSLMPHGRFGEFKRQLAKKHNRSVSTLQKAMEIYLGEPDHEKAKGKGFAELIRTVRAGKRRERSERRAMPLPGLPTPLADEAVVVGDSLDWLRAQPSESVPFFVSDPPYGIGFSYDGWTEPDKPEPYWAWFSAYWREMVRVLVPGGAIMLFHTATYLHHFGGWFPGCTVVSLCRHTKSGCRYWEPLVWWSKGKPLVPIASVNDWIAENPRGRSKYISASDHPCVKSLPLCEEIISRYTRPGALVVDPFCGTGTVLVACKNLNRRFVGIERSPRFADEAKGRLSEPNKQH